MIDRISYRRMEETENASNKTDRPGGLGSRSGTQVRYLDMKARGVVSLRDWLTMIVVLVTLGLFVAVIFKWEKPEAIALVVTAMAGIFGAYAGVHIKGAVNKE